MVVLCVPAYYENEQVLECVWCVDLTVIVVVLCVPAYYENEQVLECVWCGPNL